MHPDAMVGMHLLDGRLQPLVFQGEDVKERLLVDGLQIGGIGAVEQRGQSGGLSLRTAIDLHDRQSSLLEGLSQAGG